MERCAWLAQDSYSRMRRGRTGCHCDVLQAGRSIILWLALHSPKMPVNDTRPGLSPSLLGQSHKQDFGHSGLFFFFKLSKVPGREVNQESAVQTCGLQIPITYVKNGVARHASGELETVESQRSLDSQSSQIRKFQAQRRTIWKNIVETLETDIQHQPLTSARMRIHMHTHMR